VAPAGHSFIAADYNAFEVRILAALSGDPLLLHAVQQRDAHQALAQAFFGSPGMRQRAKHGVYSLIYGSTRDGFWKAHPELSRDNAEDIFDNVSKHLVTAVAYREDFLRRYRRSKLRRVVTPGGWRRMPRDKYNSNDTGSPSALRAAFNALIQGHGADIFRRVLRELDARLASVGGSIAHQAHDGVFVLVPDQNVASASQLVVTVMEGAAQASSALTQAGVPLIVKRTKAGRTWAALR
jgi:DNA polymerase-1